MHTGKRRENGNAALEFTLTSIPLLFVIISVVQMSLGMWNYHTLNEAVNVTTRTAALRGSDCASLSCAMTVGQITQMLTTKGIGLLSGSLNVTLTDNNGSINCNPVSSCTSSSTVWPRSGGNTVGQVISISATYPFTSAISMFVPGRGQSSFGSVTFSAISQQVISY
ncbi:MAG TPA: TadE family protein [Bryobacteraceae bacterium]|nr:TadE family protein [Bryobacteraceae bacterium]